MAIGEGVEDELDYVEYHQLTEESVLRVEADDWTEVSPPGLPGPNLLAVSNHYNLFFFPLNKGFGWAPIMETAKSDLLNYSSFNLESSPTAIKTFSEDRLVIGAGKSIYRFDIRKLLDDPAEYEPERYSVPSKIKAISSTDKKCYCLCGSNVYEVSLDNGVSDPLATARFISSHGDRLVSSDGNSIKIHAPDHKVLRSFDKPEELDHLEMVSLAFVSQKCVLVAMESVEKKKAFIEIYNVNIEDGEWSQFFDPTMPRLRRPSMVLFSAINGWSEEDLADLVIVGNASSPSIGTFAKKSAAGPMASMILTTEEFLAQLPVSMVDSRQDQYPIGIDVSLVGPDPILWILTNEGIVCPYKIVKTNSPGYPYCITASGHGLYRQFKRQRIAHAEIEEDEEEDNVVPKEGNKPNETEVAVVPTLPVKPEESAPQTEEKQKQPQMQEMVPLVTGGPQYLTQDLGKFTNALMVEFMALQSEMKNDFSQIRDMLILNRDRLRALHHPAEDDVGIDDISRRIEDVGQGCDNPAFLDLYGLEMDLRGMTLDVLNGTVQCKQARQMIAPMREYQGKVQDYRGSFDAALDRIERRVNELVNLQDNPDRVHAADFTEENLHERMNQIGERCNTLLETIGQLERDLIKADPYRVPTPPLFKDPASLNEDSLRMSPVKQKPINKPFEAAVSKKYTAEQIVALSAKFRQRSPRDCIHVYQEGRSGDKSGTSSSAGAVNQSSFGQQRGHTQIPEIFTRRVFPRTIPAKEEIKEQEVVDEYDDEEAEEAGNVDGDEEGGEWEDEDGLWETVDDDEYDDGLGVYEGDAAEYEPIVVSIGPKPVAPFAERTEEEPADATVMEEPEALPEEIANVNAEEETRDDYQVPESTSSSNDTDSLEKETGSKCEYVVLENVPTEQPVKSEDAKATNNNDKKMRYLEEIEPSRSGHEDEERDAVVPLEEVQEPGTFTTESDEVIPPQTAKDESPSHPSAESEEPVKEKTAETVGGDLGLENSFSFGLGSAIPQQPNTSSKGIFGLPSSILTASAPAAVVPETIPAKSDGPFVTPPSNFLSFNTPASSAFGSFKPATVPESSPFVLEGETQKSVEKTTFGVFKPATVPSSFGFGGEAQTPAAKDAFGNIKPATVPSSSTFGFGGEETKSAFGSFKPATVPESSPFGSGGAAPAAGFGQTATFRQASAPGQSAFAQPASSFSGFGQPSSFGQSATPSFGQSATPSFGQTTFGQTSSFGSAASGGSAFGQASTFGSNANPSGGGAGFGQTSSFGSAPMMNTSFSQPSKVFGQQAASGPTGFGALASNSNGDSSSSHDTTKKLAPSFTQFRG